MNKLIGIVFRIIWCAVWLYVGFTTLPEIKEVFPKVYEAFGGLIYITWFAIFSVVQDVSIIAEDTKDA